MKDSLIIAFSQTIRTYRERTNLTQAQLADYSHVSESYIQRLEYGQRTPTLTVFLDLAHALKVDPLELLQETLTLQKILIKRNGSV